ncbi:MAG: hypothetical protein HKN84_06110 [Gammaproteobacteria bacterium]|nr:hypothetical protein [Gammaproteobacteria bacterium]
MTKYLLVLIYGLGFTSAGQAHHGGGSYWTEDQLVGPVTGTATGLSFNFPHVSFSLDIPDEQGNLVNHTMSIRWTPTVLRRMGWRRNSIEPGDKLTVTFVPHKQDPTVGALRSLVVNDVPLAIEPPAEED